MSTINMRKQIAGIPIVSTLTFNDYQAMTNDTAIYPGKGTLDGLMYLGLGLGEAGEVQGKIKKIFRDPNIIIDHAAIGSELGDLLWYVAQTAEAMGLSLGEIAENNLIKLEDRKKRGVLGGSGDNR